MKKILNNLLVLSLLITVFTSCKKDENKIFFEGGTAPVVSASLTGPLVLLIGNRNDPSVSFNWTNPDYKFTTGISSQDVIYTLQFDTTGSNFTNPKKGEISISNDLSKAFTVGQLNTALLAMGLLEDMPHEVEIRIKSSLSSGTGVLYSNVIKIVVTPFLDVAVPVPVNGDLWITGDAVSSGWSNPLGSPFVVSQKFTKISNILYELTISMPGGGGYKLLQDNGNWATQYHMLAGGTWSGGSFEKRDADPQFPGPLSAGTYKISVNFKTGKFTVTQ